PVHTNAVAGGNAAPVGRSLESEDAHGQILLDPTVIPAARLTPRRAQLQSNVTPIASFSMAANPAAPRSPAPSATVSIASLDQEGRGRARGDGNALFVQGALPGEIVTIVTQKKKPTYELARTERIVKASPARVDPRCPHFGVCGGC